MFKNFFLKQYLDTRLFQNFTDKVLKSDGIDCNLAIPILIHAVRQLSQNLFNRLTNLHASLFALCLKSRQFKTALPFFRINVIELFLTGNLTEGASTRVFSQAKDLNYGLLTPNLNESKQIFMENCKFNHSIVDLALNLRTETASSTLEDILMSVDTVTSSQTIHKIQLNYRSVLLFFYYGAMILAAMNSYKAAFLYLEHAICLPATRLSAITLECVKKYILIGLILDYPQPLAKLPEYRPNVIQRVALPMAITYVSMAQTYAKASVNNQDVAGVVRNYLQTCHETLVHVGFF